MADVCWVGEASHRGAHRDSKSVIRGTRQKEITRNQLFRNTHTPHTHIFLNGYTTIRKAKETIRNRKSHLKSLPCPDAFRLGGRHTGACYVFIP